MHLVPCVGATGGLLQTHPKEKEMKTAISALLAITVLAGVAATSAAQAGDPSYGSRKTVCDHGDC